MNITDFQNNSISDHEIQQDHVLVGNFAYKCEICSPNLIEKKSRFLLLILKNRGYRKTAQNFSIDLILLRKGRVIATFNTHLI